MPFATTIATNLASGNSLAVTGLAGTYQVCIYGTFTATATLGNNPVEATAVLEISPDDGTTWVPVPGAGTSIPTTWTVDVGTGGQMRLKVVSGGTGVSITAKAAAKP